jgi:hypothetical protein
MRNQLKRAFVLLFALTVVGFPQASAAAPAAPTNVTVSNASLANTATDAAQANVSWTAVTGAIAYYVNATAAGTTTTTADATNDEESRRRRRSSRNNGTRTWKTATYVDARRNNKIASE